LVTGFNIRIWNLWSSMFSWWNKFTRVWGQLPASTFSNCFDVVSAEGSVEGCWRFRVASQFSSCFVVVSVLAIPVVSIIAFHCSEAKLFLEVHHCCFAGSRVFSNWYSFDSLAYSFESGQFCLNQIDMWTYSLRYKTFFIYIF